MADPSDPRGTDPGLAGFEAQLAEAEAAAARAAERVNAALAAVGEPLEQGGRRAAEFSRALTRAFDGAAVRGRDLSQVLLRLQQDLLGLALKALVPGGEGRALAQLLPPVATAAFAGARAAGGPVEPGRAYLVGERGPELLVPGRPAEVVPAAPAAAGPPTVVIHQTIHATDAGSFARSRRQIAEDLVHAARGLR